MFTAMLSFFSGSLFRMVWGEFSSWMTKKQDHKNELELLRFQVEADDKRHERELSRLRLQSELGVKEVQIKGDIALDQADAEGFYKAFGSAMQPTGIKLIDVWNSAIRPAFATTALVLWILKLDGQAWVMNVDDLAIFFSIVGFFFADRTLQKRGK